MNAAGTGSGASLDASPPKSQILFILFEGRWRQFHHHGSIDDPKMLQLYQAAIL
jgi:hypothetical protein